MKVGVHQQPPKDHQKLYANLACKACNLQVKNLKR